MWSNFPKSLSRQAGRAVLFLIDACHLAMRALLHQCELDEAAGALPSREQPFQVFTGMGARCEPRHHSNCTFPTCQLVDYEFTPIDVG